MKTIEYTPDHISYLEPNEIFVFGSNLQGHHGGGAARYAFEHFGAEWGVGVGMTGHCYAIPTMHGGVKEIKPYVDEFIDFAAYHPWYKFMVTPIGCGIAGFTPEQIAPLFYRANKIPNIVLPREFHELMNTMCFKQCAKGHYYTGSDTCPYCGHKEKYIPRCPYCGKTIRKAIPDVKWPIVGSFEGGAYDHKVPWNYGWDGICESCGHDFTIKMIRRFPKYPLSNMDNDIKTTVKVSAAEQCVYRDSFIGVSGILIKQENSAEGTTEMFISTKELVCLINALENSPILEQWDWRKDTT